MLNPLAIDSWTTRNTFPYFFTKTFGMDHITEYCCVFLVLHGLGFNHIFEGGDTRVHILQDIKVFRYIGGFRESLGLSRVSKSFDNGSAKAFETLTCTVKEGIRDSACWSALCMLVL
jgi:hypothetical protein